MDRREAIDLYQKGEQTVVDKLIQLSDEVGKLQAQVGQLKKKLEVISKYKKRTPKRRSKPSRLWGRKEGHPGCTRPAPDHIDEEVQLTLEQCWQCHGPLSASQGTMEHVQEDIIPSRVKVTKYIHHRYWCGKCHKIITAPPAPDEIPCAYLGPNALTQIVLLKYHHGLPGNKIVEIFKEFSSLKVSEGAVFQALQRLAKWLGVERDQILRGIRKSPYNHMDETGGKINGVAHWLWATVNERFAHYRTEKSRGAKVAKEILGDTYEGGLVTDFYSAYNRVPCGYQQKCLVHISREMRQLKSRDAPEDFFPPHKKFKRLLGDGKRLVALRVNLQPWVYNRRVRRIRDRLLDFVSAIYTNKNWQRLSKRLLKHHDHIFKFLEVPGLPSDNNLAERMIRHHVILRNRSFQHRTQNGAHAYDVLTSILHSLRLQARDPTVAINQAYLHHRQQQLGGLLFPTQT